MKKLLLVSTFRHLFLSLSLASKDKNEWHVLFIDQTLSSSKSPIVEAAKEILEPFSSVNVLSVRSEGESKFRYRLRVFKELEAILTSLKPSEIITGNDRRVEFQFAIHFCKKIIDLKIKGAYLDDGTASYRNMYDYRPFGVFLDRYLDTPLKKIIYGLWFDRPESIGASKWVEKSYLCWPSMSLSSIKSQKLSIDPEVYQSDYLRALIRKYTQYIDDVEEVGTGPVSIFILPHSSIMSDLYGDTEKLTSKIRSFLKKCPNGLIKYHPREDGDPLNLQSFSTLLSSKVPAEFYLSIFDFDLVVGDVSTALLSAKWLNKNADVYYIPSKSKHSNAMLSIYSELEIQEITL